MYNNNKILRRYSESFKLKILTELSHGNYTKSKLGKIYGINPSTINQWIKKHLSISPNQFKRILKG